eukprot:12005938-Heterocapsa_arctica.AAC.1
MESASSSKITLLHLASAAGVSQGCSSGEPAAWTPGMVDCTVKASSRGSCCAGCPRTPCGAVSPSGSST